MTGNTHQLGRRRARVTKDPDVRREELLDQALVLCRRDGFDSMSVEQLTRSAGVAKGTFYHYFSSKDELLEQLVRRFGDSLFRHLSAAPTEGDAAQRLAAIMAASAAFKFEQAEIAYASFLYREENQALRSRLYSHWRELARQVLLPVIRDGQQDGSLSVIDVEATTDIVLLLWFDAADQLWIRALQADDEASFIEIMLTGAAAILTGQARVLGLPEEAYQVPAGEQTTELMRQLYATLDRELP